MAKKFQFDEKIILFFLLNVFFLSLSIPFLQILNIFSVKITLFVVVIVSAFSFTKINNYKIYKPGILESLLLLILINFLISNFYFNFTENLNYDSVISIATYIISVVLFFFMMAKRLRTGNEKFDLFTDYILFFAIVLSFVSLIFYASGIHAIPQYSHSSAGLFGHPNTTSMFYTICIPVLIYKYFTKRISFAVFSVLMFLFVTVLLFTYSRAGYIGVGVGILIYTYYRSKTLFFFVLLFVVLIAATIVMEFATSKVDSSLSRILLISAAISIITFSEKSFLWGYGPVNAIQKFQQEKLFYGDEPVKNPHNVFLMLSMQFGVLFTAIVTISVLVLLIKGMRLKSRNKNFDDDQRLGLSLTIVAGLSIQNFLEDVLVDPNIFFMSVYFIFAGYIFYSIRLKDLLVNDENSENV